MHAVIPSGDLSVLLKIGYSPLKHDPVKDPDAAGYGRIAVKDGRLVIESSSTTMAARGVGECEGEDGYCCVPLESLSDMLKVMPDGEDAVLDYKDQKLLLKVGKSKCSFGCLHPDALAPLGTPPADVPGIEVELDALVKSIGAAAVSGEPNDADGIRSNVLLAATDKGFHAVATDNIRCSIVPVEATYEGEFKGTVSIKGSKALKTFESETVKIVELGESILFMDGDSFIQFQQSTQVLKSFPDFRPIMDVKHIDEVKMSTERFTTLMAGARKINPQECILTVEDEEVVVTNLRSEDGTEYRGVTAYDGEPGYGIRVGIAPLLVAEYLKTLKSDSLSLLFSQERNELDSPSHILIKDEDGSWFFVKSLVCLIETPNI